MSDVSGRHHDQDLEGRKRGAWYLENFCYADIDLQPAATFATRLDQLLNVEWHNDSGCQERED
tara:strand:+ start:2567 stop:2755 length:189 start_codon:yes stop_codon:yes gene_type:complete